jgi:hypothetical protein
MAVDNRIKEWELVTNTTKNLFMQDQSMTMFDHESDGNFGRVIGTPGVDPGGVANGWATTYSIAEALGTIDSRPAGTNAVFQLRAISGTWTASIGSATLSGTGGAASSELFAGRNVIINGKVNKVYGTTGANTISLYKATDFAGTYTVYEVVTVAERLNGVQNSNEPDLSYSGAALNYAGITSVRNLPTSITAGSLTVTGAAGWRYVVCTTGGVISVETIPVSEITANTQQHTPEPVFNATYQGYYSTVNPTKRIIAIMYFNGTNILELIKYGNGRKKNDDFWYSRGSGIQIGTDNLRFQYTASFARTRGTNIVIVDNGSGSTDSEGLRITINGSGILNVSLDVSFSLIGSASSALNINKNGSSFRLQAALLYNTSGTFNLSFFDQVQPGDYFTFYQNTVSGSAATSINNPSVRFTEY